MDKEKVRPAEDRNTEPANPLENMPSFAEHMKEQEQAPKLKSEDGKTLQGITDKIGFDQLDDILSQSVRMSEVQELNGKSWKDVVNDFREMVKGDIKTSVIGKEVYEHAKQLGQDGKIGQDVAKVWLNPVMIEQSMGLAVGAKIYDAIENRNSGRVSEEKQQLIRGTILKLAKRYPQKDVEVQSILGINPIIDENSILKQKEGFVHFNDTKQGSGVDMRCYISLNPEKRDRALKVWHDALVDSGVKDNLYYKVGITDQHVDDIVIYRSDAVADKDLKKTLEIFSERGQAEDLLDTENAMPTGRSIAPGMAIAPETKYVNNYLKVTGNKKHSYNTFVARMVELSACVASDRMENNQMRYAKISDGVKSGQIHSTKNRDFRREMRGAFREFMMLAKINPNTMLPVEYGDELPAWAKLG